MLSCQFATMSCNGTHMVSSFTMLGLCRMSLHGSCNTRPNFNWLFKLSTGWAASSMAGAQLSFLWQGDLGIHAAAVATYQLSCSVHLLLLNTFCDQRSCISSSDDSADTVTDIPSLAYQYTVTPLLTLKLATELSLQMLCLIYFSKWSKQQCASSCSFITYLICSNFCLIKCYCTIIVGLLACNS